MPVSILEARATMDRSDYLRSLIGRYVTIVAAPEARRHLVSLVARVEEIEQFGVVALVNPGNDFPVLLDGVADGWSLEVFEMAPLRRAREVYDHESFVEDLDLAINQIRAVARDERATVPAEPHIPPGTPMRESIARVCDALVLRQAAGAIYEQFLEVVLQNTRELLISKNKQYGNSALDPVRVFSTASLKEQLLVRLDDKVSRLARGSAAGEDVAADMLGYLLLVSIAEAREK